MRNFRLYKVESGSRAKDPVIVEGFLKAEEKPKICSRKYGIITHVMTLMSHVLKRKLTCIATTS